MSAQLLNSSFFIITFFFFFVYLDLDGEASNSCLAKIVWPSEAHPGTEISELKNKFVTVIGGAVISNSRLKDASLQSVWRE